MWNRLTRRDALAHCGFSSPYSSLPPREIFQVQVQSVQQPRKSTTGCVCSPCDCCFSELVMGSNPIEARCTAYEILGLAFSLPKLHFCSFVLCLKFRAAILRIYFKSLAGFEAKCLCRHCVRLHLEEPAAGKCNTENLLRRRHWTEPTARKTFSGFEAGDIRETRRRSSDFELPPVAKMI